MALFYIYSGPKIRVKIIILISQPKHMLLVLKRSVSMRRVFGHQKHMFKLMGKIMTLLHLTGPMIF